MLLDAIFGPFADLGPLIIRLALGCCFIVHGYGKLFTDKPGVKRFSERLGSLGVPFPLLAALVAGGSEFFGGIALIVGIATRWAALFLAFDMILAIQKVAYKMGFTKAPDGFGYEYPMVLLAGSLALLVMGAGPISLDGILGFR